MPAALQLPLLRCLLLPPPLQNLAGDAGPLLPPRQLGRGCRLRLPKRGGLRLLGLWHLLRQLGASDIEFQQLTDRVAFAGFVDGKRRIPARAALVHDLAHEPHLLPAPVALWPARWTRSLCSIDVSTAAAALRSAAARSAAAA